MEVYSSHQQDFCCPNTDLVESLQIKATAENTSWSVAHKSKICLEWSQAHNRHAHAIDSPLFLNNKHTRIVEPFSQIVSILKNMPNLQKKVLAHNPKQMNVNSFDSNRMQFLHAERFLANTVNYFGLCNKMLSRNCCCLWMINYGCLPTNRVLYMLDH